MTKTNKNILITLILGAIILTAFILMYPVSNNANQTVILAVREYAVEKYNISEDEVVILTVDERDWSDSCLGLGGPAESCLQAITPGYEVRARVGAEERVFRTNSDGTSVREDIKQD